MTAQGESAKPDDIFAEVQRSQPGTWPTSAADLIGGSPAAEHAVSPPIPREEYPDDAYIPSPAEAVGLTGRGEPSPVRDTQPNGAASFTAFCRIDGEIGYFELTTTGPAQYIEHMIHSFADNFVEEMNRSKE